MRNNDYMDNIYDVIYSPEVEYNDDDIIYLDEPEDEFGFGYDDELSWADNITYLDDPEEEDEFNLDLGDGFIPLYQSNFEQPAVVVIDEYYTLDEYEEDLVENYEKPAVEETQEVDYSLDQIYNVLDNDMDAIGINLDEVESMIKFPVQQDLAEELQVTDMSEEDDKIAKAIAREHLDNVKAGEAVGAIFGDVDTPEDDTSWVDGDDLFGNNIETIIAEDPNKEVVEDDYVEGSFSQWLTQQNQ